MNGYYKSVGNYDIFMRGKYLNYDKRVLSSFTHLSETEE